MGHCAIQIVGFVVYPGCYGLMNTLSCMLIRGAPRSDRSAPSGERSAFLRSKSIGIEIAIVCVSCLTAAVGERLRFSLDIELSIAHRPTSVTPITAFTGQ